MILVVLDHWKLRKADGEPGSSGDDKFEVADRLGVTLRNGTQSSGAVVRLIAFKGSRRYLLAGKRLNLTIVGKNSLPRAARNHCCIFLRRYGAQEQAQAACSCADMWTKLLASYFAF